MPHSNWNALYVGPRFIAKPLPNTRLLPSNRCKSDRVSTYYIFSSQGWTFTGRFTLIRLHTTNITIVTPKISWKPSVLQGHKDVLEKMTDIPPSQNSVQKTVVVEALAATPDVLGSTKANVTYLTFTNSDFPLILSS